MFEVVPPSLYEIALYTVNDWLRYILKKYILPHITPHGFRHTHASLLLEAGESVKVVQQRLGMKIVK